MTEDLGTITGFEGIEFRVEGNNIAIIDGVVIGKHSIAVCRADMNGHLFVKYLRKRRIE